MNDFTGFTFCGSHSFADLHIVRVSDGSRYNETLIPNFQDVTASVPGRDGQLYWESFYSTKTHPLKIAFDNLDETGLRLLRQKFDGKTEGWLIFDELPFKQYWAKAQSPIQLNYICFEEGENKRLYKGEGTLTFISYDPFARSVHNYLNEFDDSVYLNKDEWSAASGMKATSSGYDQTNSATITVFNAGDLATDWSAYFNVSNIGSLSTIQLVDASDPSARFPEVFGTLQFTGISAQGSDSHIRISSRTNLIEGLDSYYKPTGTLYNKYITGGDFFQIPTGGDCRFTFGVSCEKVEYNFLYY